MWESMGPIADRSEDRLGSSDRAIFVFRTQMYRAAQAVADGKPAIGVSASGPVVPHSTLLSYQGMVPKGKDWREYNISDEERELRALSDNKRREEQGEGVVA